MRRLALIVATLALLASPAAADPPKPLTVAQALQALQGLRALDGHQVVVGGQVVVVPWEFKNGALRVALAADVGILTAVETSQNKVRIDIIHEVLKDHPGETEVKPGTPEMDAFLKQYQQVLDAPAAGIEGLQHIREQDLHLDANEIPAGVLYALSPILDK